MRTPMMAAGESLEFDRSVSQGRRKVAHDPLALVIHKTGVARTVAVREA
jgi:hypothetical protein